MSMGISSLYLIIFEVRTVHSVSALTLVLILLKYGFPSLLLRPESLYLFQYRLRITTGPRSNRPKT